MTDDGTERMGFEGEYLSIRPNTRLVLTWSKFETGLAPPAGAQKSQVEITLKENGAGTDIRIVHSAIEDDATRRGFSGGWEHGMKNLDDLLSDFERAEIPTD